MSKKNTRHGMAKTSEYKTWYGMSQRCHNTNDKSYPSYGGRGIKVCDKWRGSFIEFFNDIGKRPTANHSLDRINNDGDYEPGNCRWASRSEQGNNRRTNLMVTVDGTTDTVAVVAKKFNICQRLVYNRITNGWDINDAFKVDNIYKLLKRVRIEGFKAGQNSEIAKGRKD